MTNNEIHEAFRVWFGDDQAGSPMGNGKFQLPDMRGAIKDIAAKSFRAGAEWGTTQPQAPQGAVTAQFRELLTDLVACVGMSLEDRQRHFDFERYSAHAGFCRRPRGDQSCQCGYSSMRAGLEAHLDECTGYQGTAAIDKARAFLANFPAAPETPEGKK